MDYTGVILAIAFVVIVNILMSRKSAAEPLFVPSKKKECPPHKWEWRQQPGSEDNYMICNICKSFPSGGKQDNEN